MSAPEIQLRSVIGDARSRLDAISDDVASVPRAPGKWSRKEIVGHLIDSASINHERFVRAQFSDDLISPPYDQDAWVRAQHYRDAAWSELVSLWAHFNLHLARVVESIPREMRDRKRARHNLNEVAFHAIPADEPATLEYFMRDYVAHLEHHLAQIFG